MLGGQRDDGVNQEVIHRAPINIGANPDAEFEVVDMDELERQHQEEEARRHQELRNNRELLGTQSYQYGRQRVQEGQEGQEGQNVQVALTAVQQIQGSIQNVNHFIEDNYEGVFEQKTENIELQEPANWKEKIKFTFAGTDKPKRQMIKSGKSSFGEIAKLQKKLRKETDREKKLELKEKIIEQRKKGLVSYAQVTSNEDAELAQKKYDVGISQQVELGALYEAELAALEHVDGEDALEADVEYAEVLRAKLADTKSTLEKREKRRKDVNLAALLANSYEQGKRAFHTEYEETKRGLHNREFDRTALTNQFETDKNEFGEAELNIKMIANENPDQPPTYTDAISVKYKTLLATEFTCIEQFEASQTEFERMRTDINTICTAKKALYEEYTGAISTKENEKKDIMDNPELSQKQKQDQIKLIDEAIKEQQKKIGIVEKETRKLLEYDFFLDRMRRLSFLFSHEMVSHIIAAKTTIFKDQAISYKYYDSSQIGEARMERRLDVKLGRPERE